MISSGITAKSTSGDSAITLISAPIGDHSQALIINESGIVGFYSIDGGANWIRMPASSTSPAGATYALIPYNTGPAGIQFKRVAGGTDVTGLFATLF